MVEGYSYVLCAAQIKSAHFSSDLKDCLRFVITSRKRTVKKTLNEIMSRRNYLADIKTPFAGFTIKPIQYNVK